MADKKTKQSRKDMENLIENLNRNEDVKLNRRAFIKAAFGTTVAIGVATTPFAYLTLNEKNKPTDKRVKIAKISDIPRGTSKEFSYPKEKDSAIIIHTPEGNLKAYNNQCTHLKCPVVYENKKSELVCPCHKGYFSVNSGHPLSGPPQRELPKILLEVDNGIVYAVGREIRHG